MGPFPAKRWNVYVMVSIPINIINWLKLITHKQSLTLRHIIKQLKSIMRLLFYLLAMFPN